MNRTAIGLDATPLLGQQSGVGHYTGRLLSALLAHRPEWDFLLFSNRPLGQLEPPLSRAFQVDGYLPRSRWLWAQTMLPKLVARSQPDLCHYTNGLAPLWRKAPYVLSIHDASLFLYRRLHPRARLVTIRLLLPLVARRASAIITMSHSARRDLLRVLRVPADKIRVVYEAAPDEFGLVQDEAHLAYLQQKYKLPDQFLLYIGTLEPRKNLHRLIRAFGQVRRRGFSVGLVMAGPRGWLMEDFECEIERLGLQDSVRLLGYVPEKDLPGLYSLATLFVFPSLYEGFGLPPLEAMACGLPVLSSNNSSLGEICANAAFLVDPHDEEDLADGMVRLLSDADLREELRREGLRRAGQFSWHQTAVQTASVYSQVMADLS